MKKHVFLFSFYFLFLIFPACQNWGAWDEPAGNQKNPVPPDASVRVIAFFPFETDLAATDTDITGEAIAYEGGVAPEITGDSERGNVLYQNNGYTRFKNPMP